MWDRRGTEAQTSVGNTLPGKRLRGLNGDMKAVSPRPWASVSPSEGRDSRETGGGLGRLALGNSVCGQAPEFQVGRVHTQALVPGPPGKGLGGGLPIPCAARAWLWPPHSTASPSSNVPSSVPPPDLGPKSHSEGQRQGSSSAQPSSPAPTPGEGQRVHGHQLPQEPGVLLPPCPWLQLPKPHCPVSPKRVITRLLLAQAHFQGREVCRERGER